MNAIPIRFQVCYIPRAALVLAAEAVGWTEEGGGSLLDAVDHFCFYEVDSEHAALEPAIARGMKLVRDGLDFFGQATVEEQEYRLTYPAENLWEWETVSDHIVDETGLVETVHRDDGE